MTTDRVVLYRCARCKAEFVSPHFRDVRMATGRTVEHCGTPAFFVRAVAPDEDATALVKAGQPRAPVSHGYVGRGRWGAGYGRRLGFRR